MSQSFSETLEWNKLVRAAIDFARTEPGKEFVRHLYIPEEWARDRAESQLWQEETREVGPLLSRAPLWGALQELESVDSILVAIEKEKVLQLDQLVSLRRWLDAVEIWAQTPKEDLSGSLKEDLGDLMDPFQPLRLLNRVVTEKGEFNEKASKKLEELHGRRRKLKTDVSSVMKNLMKSYGDQGVLQESFTDIRDGRFVLPVKIERQSDVDGRVYEASVSRKTVFVEPKEIAILNNDLQRIENDIEAEIYRILLQLTIDLAEFKDEMGDSVSILAHWDSVAAKAILGKRYSGQRIQVTESEFQLNSTAHPLLWLSKKPEDITLNGLRYEGEQRLLLITGPNAGGKTVLLKTIGLAAICARTGFLFPGMNEHFVPFFNEIFIDLGDPQSIEEELSSFAGHIVGMRDILAKNRRGALILLDELNSSTDPSEGAALSRAILEELIEGHPETLPFAVATTHDPVLKSFGFSHDRIQIASMEFNEDDRSPTYRIRLGVPGRSMALEIAEKLGIPDKILVKARKYLSKEHQRFEQVVRDLEAERSRAEQARREANRHRDQAEQLERKWKAESERGLGEVLDSIRSKVKRAFVLAEDEVRAAIRKMQESGNAKSIEGTRKRLGELASATEREIFGIAEKEMPETTEALKEKIAAKIEEEELKVDQWVRVPKWKNVGRIIELDKDRVKVQLGKGTGGFGSMIVDLKPEELSPMEQPAKKIEKQKETQLQDSKTGVNVPTKIDLRGVRFEEAMIQLEEYLDHAFRQGHPEITIVHGVGTGALKKGTLELLATLPYVENYRDGGPGQGGGGATVVNF